MGTSCKVFNIKHKKKKYIKKKLRLLIKISVACPVINYQKFILKIFQNPELAMGIMQKPKDNKNFIPPPSLFQRIRCTTVIYDHYWFFHTRHK